MFMWNCSGPGEPRSTPTGLVGGRVDALCGTVVALESLGQHPQAWSVGG